MAASKGAMHATPADTTKAMDAFMLALDHPHKALVEAIRASILRTDRTIAEGVKWNAPSFRTTEYFATTNLREKHGVGVVLHLGAKARTLPAGGLDVDDPSKLLKWLGKDHAMIVFESLDDFGRRRKGFEALVRSWIDHV